MSAIDYKERALQALSNSRDLLVSAEAVFRAGNASHAFGLLTLSAEELAKAWICSRVVSGYVTVGPNSDPTIMSVSEADFSNHRSKDEWFASMVVHFTLAPLIARKYWVTRGPGSPVFEIVGFDPQDYQSFTEFYTSMDPGIAASLLDRSGVSEKRMGLLTTLSLQIRRSKNLAFYTDGGGRNTPSEIRIEKGDYLGLKDTIEWLLGEAGPGIESASPEDSGKSLGDHIRAAVEKQGLNPRLRDRNSSG